ncbi:hypothetical protein HDF11_002270 [Tunturiibacter psychrotolerans]
MCPAGRARCARGGHFVACVPVGAGREVVGLPLVGVRFSLARQGRRVTK